jgi:dolichyl-phosphate-mannose-protein mannosyltransferase
MNNDWMIIKETEKDVDYEQAPIEFVKDGDLVRLAHIHTGRNLHSHVVEAPVSKGEYEVSGYGNRTLSDPNDLWVVELASGQKTGNDNILHSLGSQFRLRHQVLNCYLKANNKHLPEWGFKQIEVTCDKKATKKTDRSLLWNVESQKNERLPKGDPSQYKSNFWKDFIDCNVGMFMTNNALTPNPDHEPSIITSLPKHWWWMTRGIRMSSWDASKTKFFMLGTPTVWWGGSMATVVLGASLVALILLSKRKMVATNDYQHYLYQLKITLGGWALHYLPFFLMGRVTYVHHYYPALIYGILCFGVMFDGAVKRASGRTRAIAALVYGALTALNFVYFSPMAYGMNGASVAYKGRQWMKSWNLY